MRTPDDAFEAAIAADDEAPARRGSGLGVRLVPLRPPIHRGHR